jgi:hypothetical protein
MISNDDMCNSISMLMMICVYDCIHIYIYIYARFKQYVLRLLSRANANTIRVFFFVTARVKQLVLLCQAAKCKNKFMWLHSGTAKTMLVVIRASKS